MTEHSDPAPSSPSDLYDTIPASEMLTARRVALQVLQDIFIKHQNLDSALDDKSAFQTLNQRDRAFVRMLVSTTLRRLGQIDDVIRKSLSRPDQPLSPPILHQVLRLGVAQLLFMHVPDHAAVNTSVLLVESEGHGRMKGFVNAILRRVAHDGREWTTKQDAARLNTPEWLLKLWINDYALRGAIDIANANAHEPSLDITLKNPHQASEWAQSLEAQILPTGSLRLLHHKMIQDLPGFQDGEWWVQDAAAAIPATLFGNIAGKKIVDLCAAPGGKTAQLAAQGADVIAVDRSAKRLLRLQENMKRLGLDARVKTEVADAGVWKPREKLDYILLDAPCSATGTVRRNPDVPWLKSLQDLKSLMDLQVRLLLHACDMLAENGVLIYCTCSLQKDEGEHQIENLLASRPDMQRVRIMNDEVAGLSDLITPMGDVRVLPHHLGAMGGMDGFFVSRLRKIS